MIKPRLVAPRCGAPVGLRPPCGPQRLEGRCQPQRPPTEGIATGDCLHFAPPPAFRLLRRLQRATQPAESLRDHPEVTHRLLDKRADLWGTRV